MTISNAAWRKAWDRDIKQRLYLAHEDLSRIADLLRDVAQEVWTETPSDHTKIAAASAWSLEGWRVHYRGEFQRLNTFRTAHGALLDVWDPQAGTALDGYLASMPVIGTAFADVMASYEDGSGRLIQTTVSQVDRDSLAATIEAELQ